MTISPWPIAESSSVDKYRQTDIGYLRYPRSTSLQNVSGSATQVLLDVGDAVEFYDLNGTLLAKQQGECSALYSDVAFMKDGLIVIFSDGILKKMGTYRGTPVSKKHTIYNGVLREYNLDQMGRLSHIDKCDCPMPIGNIVYTGFDLLNKKFVVVSQKRTIVFSYDENLNYSVTEKYSHRGAVGFAEGNIIFEGDGEVGEITDIFDYTSISIGYFKNKFVSQLGGDTYTCTPQSTSRDFTAARSGLIRVACWLSAEVTQYVGGTPLIGTVYIDGTPVNSTWDNYFIVHSRLGVTINKYWLNYSTANVARQGLNLTEFSVDMLVGDVLAFGFTSRDGITTSSSYNNSDVAFQFDAIPTSGTIPSWESGVRIFVIES